MSGLTVCPGIKIVASVNPPPPPRPPPPPPPLPACAWPRPPGVGLVPPRAPPWAQGDATGLTNVGAAASTARA